MTPPRLSRVWTRDELATELRDALGLVDELDPPEDLRVAVFNVACNGLLQRVADQPNPAIALGRRGLPLGRG